MPQDFGIPPASRDQLTPPEELVERLKPLLGRRFRLTGKTRTDGSNVRKAVWDALSQHPLPPRAVGGTRIVPPKGKGVPRLLREAVDTYIITSGTSYNLQVWNRNPASEFVQVEYDGGPSILASDVRFVLVRIDIAAKTIRSIFVLTPEYIERRFGKFGKPTVKQQLLIAPKARAAIMANQPPILFHPDAPSVAARTVPSVDLSTARMHDAPRDGLLLDLATIRDIVASSLLGTRIEKTATKNRGQALEEKVARLLGYQPTEGELLAGGYPDLRHQALEVKVQDSGCVDLGMYSPQFEEGVPACPNFSTATVRYLIALTDTTGDYIQGAVVCPGANLDCFTYVSDESYKCQRSIPMSFFDQYDQQVVFNP